MYEALGRYAEALCYFSKQLAIATELDDRRVAAIALGNVARVRAAQGSDQDAERLYTQSLLLLSALNLPHYVCEMRYRLADLYARQGRFADAHASAADALRTATRLKRTAIQFAAELLDVHARVHLDQISREQAEADFLKLLIRYPDPRHQAAAHYERWRLTGAEEPRRLAADLYRSLSASVDRIEYRRRYAEVTGNPMQDPPDVPPIPGFLPTVPHDLDEVLKRAGHLLRPTVS